MRFGRRVACVLVSIILLAVTSFYSHVAFAATLHYGGYNLASDKASAFELYPDAVKSYFDERVRDVTLHTPTLDRMRAGGELASDAQGDLARFTSNEELALFLDELPRAFLRVLCLGSFPTYDDGAGEVSATFDLPLLVFSNPAVSDAHALRALGRPLVYLQGSIHGDEPSGAEALLAVALDLAANRGGLLDKLSVIIVPRLNMDGAWRNERDTKGVGPDFPSLDLNRDAVAAISPVTRAVRNMLAIWRPDVCADFHEMGYLFDGSYEYTEGDAISGYPLYYGFELATLVAHPENVPDGVTNLAYELEQGVWTALAEVGLETGRYIYPADMVPGYTQLGMDAQVDYPSQMMEGPPDECITDSAASLAPSVAILCEARSPQVLTNFKSRVYAHYTAAHSVLKQVAARPAVFRDTVAAGGAAVTAMGRSPGNSDPVTLWVKQAERATASTKALLLDPKRQHVTEQDIVHDILHTNEELTSVKSVQRPYAYAISLDERIAAPLAARLALAGASVERLGAGVTLVLEGYRIGSVLPTWHEGLSYSVRSGDYFSSGQGQVLSHAIADATTFEVPGVLPAGAYVLRMAQPSANLAALALEPLANRNLGNYWYSLTERGLDASGYIPFTVGGEWPVYRCLSPADLPLADVMFAFPLLRGAYVARALPLDLPKDALLGYRFLAERATGEIPQSFEVFTPLAAANTAVGTWYGYEWGDGEFSPLALRANDGVPVLTVSPRHIANDGEVLLIGTAHTLNDAETVIGRGGCLTGALPLASALFSLLSHIVEGWEGFWK